MDELLKHIENWTCVFNKTARSNNWLVDVSDTVPPEAGQYGSKQIVDI
jgi:hypothetical protein